jgi:hypothetical protein
MQSDIKKHSANAAPEETDKYFQNCYSLLGIQVVLTLTINLIEF